jgi:hypothetical protein
MERRQVICRVIQLHCISQVGSSLGAIKAIVSIELAIGSCETWMEGRTPGNEQQVVTEARDDTEISDDRVAFSGTDALSGCAPKLA